MPDEHVTETSPRLEQTVKQRQQHPTRRRRRPTRLLLLLGVLGPGLISAAAGDDAGGIATYAQAGASYGFQLLWIMLLITVSLAVVQEMCARMGAFTQKGLADLIREEFGVRWTAFAMLCLLVANGSTVVTEFLGIKASIQVLAGEGTWLVYLGVPLVAFLVWWLVIKGSYRRVEKIFLVMALALLSYVPAAFLSKPDWGAVLHQTVIPSFSLAGGFIATFVAIIGTTITPYMQVYVQSAVADKGIQPKEYPYEIVDVYSSSVLGNLVSYFIIIATGATLFLNHISIATADDAARALEPFAGPFAKYLFAVGLFGASMLAAAVLPLSTSYAICEAFGFERGVSRSFREAPVFQAIFTGLIIIAAVIALIPNLPIISILVNLQILNAILLPVLLVFILRLVNNRRLMGSHTNGRIYNVIAWATTIGVSVMAVLYIFISLILPLFGVNLGG
ncbi:MAG TPA: Nramp family divalent metal transporter [Ktedonobacterales bacterium]|nr:Nramp family divalent metal transporter [Ktedonobacterales bacterium]